MKIETISELLNMLSDEDFVVLIDHLKELDTDVMDVVFWVIEMEKKYNCSISSSMFEEDGSGVWPDFKKIIRDKKLNYLGIK